MPPTSVCSQNKSFYILHDFFIIKCFDLFFLFAYKTKYDWLMQKLRWDVNQLTLCRHVIHIHLKAHLSVNMEIPIVLTFCFVHFPYIRRRWTGFLKLGGNFVFKYPANQNQRARFSAAPPVSASCISLVLKFILHHPHQSVEEPQAPLHYAVGPQVPAYQLRIPRAQ